MKGVLTLIIHTGQKGFIKGRLIGETNRLTKDIIYECEVQCMQVLNKVHDNPGLQINVNKTSLSKIGYGETARHFLLRIRFALDKQIYIFGNSI